MATIERFEDLEAEVAPMSEARLIPVFIPALVTLLLHEERQKGSPLSEQEVLAIRGRGVCMMMSVERAQAFAEQRGYADIDPQNVWEEWQAVRVELARLPKQ